METIISRRHLLTMAGYSAGATMLSRYSDIGDQLMQAESRPTSSLGSLKQIRAGLLEIGYTESGPVDGPPVVLLHGWPYDVHAFEQVVPILAKKGYRVIVPYLRGFGPTRFLSDEALRNGQQSALALDVIALMNALKIRNAILAGFDWGARTAVVMAALWPERCKGLVSVSGYLIVNREANKQPLKPKAELGWWYQYYFSTERGQTGYDKYRREFANLIWKTTSPKWDFDEATFSRSAAAFDNPDHVAIVMHNYRWRLSLAAGEARYDDLEKKLADGPTITVPSITIASDFDGAAADGKGYAKKFSGRYSHKFWEGIGHNVPQEAPVAFAEAIMEVDSFPG